MASLACHKPILYKLLLLLFKYILKSSQTLANDIVNDDDYDNDPHNIMGLFYGLAPTSELYAHVCTHIWFWKSETLIFSVSEPYLKNSNQPVVDLTKKSIN